MASMLEVEKITAFYGAAQALFGVSLSVAQGQMLALLGRNGMGKSTTVRAICRLTPPADGRVRLAGRDLAGLAPHRVARLGVGLVPEGRRLFPGLSVAETLLATARPGPWTPARVNALFPRLAERAAQPARTLSGGEQQMLAIGRALTTNPRLLILDEATEGLAPVIRTEIWAAIDGLRAEGMALLVIDKTLSELLPRADSCVVLERGRDVWSGAPSDLGDDLKQRYLGV